MVESTVREGLMHLVVMVERLLVVRPTGVGRQALHPSSPAASS